MTVTYRAGRDIWHMRVTSSYTQQSYLELDTEPSDSVYERVYNAAVSGRQTYIHDSVM